MMAESIKLIRNRLGSIKESSKLNCAGEAKNSAFEARLRRVKNMR